MSLRESFALREDLGATHVRIYVPGGRERIVRLVVTFVGLAIVTLFGFLALDGNWLAALLLWASAIGALMLYEPFEAVAEVSGSRLRTSFKPRVYGWLGRHEVDLQSVTRAEPSFLAFVVLHRASGPEYLFLPLPHLSMQSGETSNARISSFVNGQLSDKQATKPDADHE